MGEVEAPIWFKEAFSLIWQDLSDIRQNIKAVKQCEVECKKNSSEIIQLKVNISKLEEQNQDLQKQITRLDLQDRKNNLLIPETCPNENTEGTAQRFLKDNLKISNPEGVSYEVVYRIGKPPHLIPTTVKQPRVLMVKFKHFEDKQKSWQARHNLRGTKFSLSEDLPTAMQQRRRIMLPYYLLARKRTHLGKYSLVQDYLLLNGKKYTLNDIDQLPSELQKKKLYQKHFTTTDGVAFYGKECFLSNFHMCRFEEGGKVFDSVEKYFQFKKALYFKDEPSAQAILEAKSPAKALALSYQIKDFDRESWDMVAKQFMYNGCALKFTQNPLLAEQLKNMKGTLVEANPNETLFSCGLSLTDAKLEDKSQWRGKNLLGDILSEIRDTL